MGRKSKRLENGGVKPNRAFRYNKKGQVQIDGVNEDICDCLEEGCEGCWMPCKKCQSQKCGPTCRVRRHWMYESVDYDGSDKALKPNPYLNKV